MAYFRPGKDASSRKLFNWAHRILGILTFVLASKRSCEKLFIKNFGD